MSNTVPHERTASPADLADEAAKLERARTGNYTRTLHALCQQAAVMVPCDHCWAPPGTVCTISGAAGYHLARFQRAERRGLITRAELAAVVAGLDVIAAHVTVRDGAA